MRKILVFLTLALILVTTLVLGFTKDRTNQSSSLPEDSSQGEALIGGDFTLVDTSGKSVQDVNYRGRIMLVFFGFTHCPDICPVTVSSLSKLMESLPPTKADQVAPLFISVDPKRDTPEVMREFLSNFDSRLVGLTGTEEQVKQAAGVYRAYYAKQEKTDQGGNYSVDHSGFIYLMDKEGKFLKAVPYDTPAEELQKLITPYLG